jgi:hypothetical protein
MVNFFYLNDKCNVLTPKIEVFLVFQIKNLHVNVTSGIFHPFECQTPTVSSVTNGNLGGECK